MLGDSSRTQGVERRRMPYNPIQYVLWGIPCGKIDSSKHLIGVFAFSTNANRLYAKTCTMHFHSTLNGLVNPLPSRSNAHSTWAETLGRCRSKRVGPSSGSSPTAYYSAFLRLGETGKTNVAQLSAFSLAWTSSDGVSRALDLKGSPSAYLRLYRQK